MVPHSLQATASAVPTALLKLSLRSRHWEPLLVLLMQRTTPVFSAGTFTARQTTPLNRLSCLCFSDFSHICAHYSSAPLWFSPHFHKESVIRPSSQFAKVCQMIVLPLKLSCTLTLPRFTCSHAFVQAPFPVTCLLSISTQMPHTHLNHNMANNNLIIIIPKWFCLGLLRCLCHCQIISGTHSATLLTSKHLWLQFQGTSAPFWLLQVLQTHDAHKHRQNSHTHKRKIHKFSHTQKKMSLLSTSHHS